MQTKQIVIQANSNTCQKCNNELIDCSFCRECRQIVQQTCLYCGNRELKDLHEFCYCQLEVLVPDNREVCSLNSLTLVVLVVAASLLVSGSGLKAIAEEQKPSVKITSTIKIGIDKHLVKYQVCAGKTTMPTQTVLIKSDSEQIKQFSKKVLAANTCASYEAKIKAKYSSLIKVQLVR